MKAKTLEIRDSGTFVPVLCVNLEPENEEQRYLFARAGYGTKPEEQSRYVIVIKIDGGDNMPAESDPLYWRWHHNDMRTMSVAHEYIVKYWNELSDGDVVDVQFILKETDKPKQSERVEVHI